MAEPSTKQQAIPPPLFPEEESMPPESAQVPVPPGGDNNNNNNINDDDKKESAPMSPLEQGLNRTNSFGNLYVPALEGIVVPKMERISWFRFIYLSFLVAIPTSIYVLYFTGMGWGETTFAYFSIHFAEYTNAVLGATMAWFLLLYILDANTWQSRLLQTICAVVLVVGIILTILISTVDYPFGPICCYAAVTPLWLLLVIQMGRAARMKHRTKDYVTSLSGPLFFISMVTMAGFIAWIFVDESNRYNQVTKVTFAQASGCAPNLAKYPECSNTYSPQTPRPTLDYPTGGGTTDHASTLPSSRRRLVLYQNDSLSYHQNPNLPNQNVTNQVYTGDAFSDEHVYTSEETGVCFDTVISPPSWTLHDGCDPDCPTYVYSDCPNALILWAGPLMASMVLFFLSFFCTFLKGNDVEKDVINFGKLWMFLLFIFWMTASLSGTGAGISTLLVALTVASFVGAVFFICMTRSKEESKEQVWELWSRFEEKFGGYLNVGRGTFLVFTTPVLIIYFFLAIINQAVRKLGLPCSKAINTPEERAGMITKRARAQITDILSWERTKVLKYGVYAGLFYMIMSVVISIFTYLLLSVLVESLKDLNLGVVTAILVAFGLAFFLNPFLPGPPLYMMNGLVLFVTGQEALGVGGALAYGVALSLIIKLLSAAMLQKWIGENLANYVNVRKLVGINTSFMKATRLILTQPGMPIDKLAILVGGPDWPVSVLCGILHLDLFPVLLSTLPVILIVAPTSLVGAFLYMGDQKDEKGDLMYPYASSLAAVATAVAALVMTALTVMAAYHIELTMSQKANEIEAIPNDNEVGELEEAEEAYNKCYEDVSKWEVLPGLAKLTMYSSFFLMVASVYVVLIFSKRCFAPFTLTSTIEEDLDGDWTNLVKPLGWVAIALFMLSLALVSIVDIWANSNAKRQLKSQSPGGNAAVELKTDDNQAP